MSLKSIITLFRGAGATSHVFFLKKGKVSDKGLAFSGFIGPQTIVAVVPTTPQILDFSIKAHTYDNQTVMVTGALSLNLAPKRAVSSFDFTVDRNSGNFTGDWNQVLNRRASEHVVRAVLEKLRTLNIVDSLNSHREIEDAVQFVLAGSTFGDQGVFINSCSIPKIEPVDSDIRAAIGADERQQLLSTSDKATHERREKAAANDRQIKQFEAETVQTLERQKAELVRLQSENKLAEAAADAKATEIRLEPLKGLKPGEVMAVGFLRGCENGRIGNVSLTSDLLASLEGAGS